VSQIRSCPIGGRAKSVADAGAGEQDPVVTTDALTGCVIVTGMPGAGKSTVSTLAAQLLPRAARVKGDDVNQMILTGRVPFNAEPADEAARQDDLCNRNMCSLANNFIDFGFTVFMDTVVADRAELDSLLQLLAPRPARLVILAPGIDVCRHRNATREPISERWEFDGYERLEAQMRRDVAGFGWWFDTAALTPHDTAARLVAEAERLPVLT
jgi:predicted kinase